MKLCTGSTSMKRQLRFCCRGRCCTRDSRQKLTCQGAGHSQSQGRHFTLIPSSIAPYITPWNSTLNICVWCAEPMYCSQDGQQTGNPQIEPPAGQEVVASGRFKPPVVQSQVPNGHGTANGSATEQPPPPENHSRQQPPVMPSWMGQNPPASQQRTLAGPSPSQPPTEPEQPGTRPQSVTAAQENTAAGGKGSGPAVETRPSVLDVEAAAAAEALGELKSLRGSSSFCWSIQNLELA